MVWNKYAIRLFIYSIVYRKVVANYIQPVGRSNILTNLIKHLTKNNI